MNDFERKLSRVPFRIPPEELRAIILAGSAREPDVEKVRWTWRDWFWPAPQAWAALAALWIILAVLSFGGRAASMPNPPSEAALSPADEKLISYHSPTALNHVLDFAN